ncbi:hypothetical protein [Ruminococcus flavefaciens]|uniref:hypothetical protein n=1 Tax=Ruminococcus flavefaciens TaxID=1265 RepID=UPI00048A60FC|nr:hypothetical protein [Ruminococcus flavefaciens]
MNKNDLFEAIDLIDDELIREAQINSETASKDVTDEPKPDITVSGVEVHRGIRWQRISAIASAFILIAGFGILGAYLHSNRPKRNVQPNEIIIPAATENTTETEDKKTESTEASTTKTTSSQKKETKESTNTVTTSKSDSETSTATPAPTESSELKPAENTKPDEKTPVVTVTQPVIIPTTTTKKAIVTSKPKTTQKPVTTTAVKPTEPKVTEPEPTTDDNWVIHLPCTKSSNVVWRSYQCPEMFEILRSIEYRHITAAEFAVTDYEMPNTYLIDADDNNRVYALNFDHKWIMRFGTDGTDCGDAPMPDRLYELFCGS